MIPLEKKENMNILYYDSMAHAYHILVYFYQNIGTRIISVTVEYMIQFINIIHL